MQLGPFFLPQHPSKKCSKAQLYRLKEIVLHASPEALHNIQSTLADIYFDRSNISLRTTEWGIFNFAKHNQSVVIQNKNILHVYETYLSWRRNYKRNMFDQYKREAEILFLDPKTKRPVSTTPAQINFFWFLVSEHLLNFLYQNKEAIKNHSKLVRSKRNRSSKLTGQQKNKKKKLGTGEPGKRELLIKTKENRPTFVVDASIQLAF